MSCIILLYIFIILLFNFFIADTNVQNQFILKSINITTLIGETIEFNCSEYMDSQQNTTSVFKWFKDKKSLHKTKNYDAMSLVNKNEVLQITNVKIIDSGIYECASSNQFQSESSIYKLTVNVSPKIKTDKRSILNETRNIGESITWLCSVLHGKDKNIDQYAWFKNGKPLRVEKSNKRIMQAKRNSLLKLINITLEDKGTYECLASNTFHIDSTIYVLNVVELQNKTFLNNFNSNISLQINESVRWRCLFSERQNISNFNYTWLKNDEPLQISKNDTNIRLLENNFVLKFKEIKFDNAGTYRCVASNELVTSYLNRTLIVVEWQTTGIFRLQQEHVLCRREKKLLALRNNISYEKVTYECEAKNYYHKIYSSYTLNFIDRKAPVIHNVSHSTTSVKLGESVQLFCYVQGMPPPMISWLKNGNPFHIIENNNRVLLLEHNQKLLFISTTLEDNGTYKCNVSNRLGSKVSISELKVKCITTGSVNHDGQIFTSLIFLILFLLLGIFLIYYIISLKKEQISKKQLENSYLQFVNVNADKCNPYLCTDQLIDLRLQDKEWEFPRDKLELDKPLGSRSFGVVFKANAIGIIDKNATTTVIVKMVKRDSESCFPKALITELNIMINVGKHLNIVNLLGTCTDEDNDKLMMIIEYCRYGSIREYLLKQRNCFVNQVTPDGFLNYNITRTSKNSHCENDHDDGHILFETRENNDLQINSENYFIDTEPVWWFNYYGDYNNIHIQPLCTHDLIYWSFQIARGMEYLASKNIFHGDLATRNILLADDNIVKINDFGLPKNMYNRKIHEKSKSVPLQVKWMAIESLRDQVFSIQSDVWSFGIVLWEIFSLVVTPYSNIKSYSDLLNRLDAGYRMEKPKYANSELYNIMLDCWKINPMSRPSFSDLAVQIRDLLSDDLKLHYTKLNENYVKMNTNKSLPVDYINIFTRPTHLNRPNLSEKNSD